MKKTTLFGRIQSLILLFVFISGSVLAGNIVVNNNVSNSLKMNENTYSFISITNTISDIGLVDVKTKEGYFTLLNIENYGKSVILGDPQLPVIKRLIEVPLNADFNIEIISQNYSEFNLSDYGVYDYLIPTQPSLSKSDDPEDVEFVYNKDIYTQDSYLGQELVTVVDLGMMRGVRIARVEIAPVLYNPVQNTIKVYGDLEVKINFTGGDVQSTIQMKENMFSPYYEGIYGELMNYKPIDGKELITDEPVTYIIVADPMFESALQPLVEWKTKKGFYVVEAYT
ncbi:MAG: hypothetical protein K8R86_09845, partial [Bacteroidales bacterium]|nr:hypothetical protein [Bacteroidales bacterium]